MINSTNINAALAIIWQASVWLREMPQRAEAKSFASRLPGMMQVSWVSRGWQRCSAITTTGVTISYAIAMATNDTG
jgi:hypothetical protein